MAKMTVGPGGIETISGALKRPKKQDGHNHGNYLVAVHRVAETTNPNCQRVYSFGADRYKRTTPKTTDQLWAETRFAAVRAAVQERKGDLMNYNNDIAAFQAQKNQPGGKKTLYSYYWSICGAAWDQAHPRS